MKINYQTLLISCQKYRNIKKKHFKKYKTKLNKIKYKTIRL